MTLPYPFPLGGLCSRPRVLSASLRGTIHRSEWGMTYGLSRGLVGDEIGLIFAFKAQRQQRHGSGTHWSGDAKLWRTRHENRKLVAVRAGT